MVLGANCALDVGQTVISKGLHAVRAKLRFCCINFDSNYNPTLVDLMARLFCLSCLDFPKLQLVEIFAFLNRVGVER